VRKNCCRQNPTWSYREHGWYMSEKLLTDDEADALAEASERYYAGHRDRRLPARPPRIAYWEPFHGYVHRHNDYIFYEGDAIRQIRSKLLIAAVAARLAKTDQIRLWNSTLIYKPRLDDHHDIVPWHFDKHYWQTCSSDEMLTAYIPFRDCGEEMGTITMVDGSHTWKRLGADDATTLHFAQPYRHELEKMLADNAVYNNTEIHKVKMVIPKGHMSFHHCRTYHGSGHNRSNQAS
jgi:ectoine hydroxylase-related dioxygenase (phytanoyl-CoA dioxygenase family)